jgi:hypothetical protein
MTAGEKSAGWNGEKGKRGNGELEGSSPSP